MGEEYVRFVQCSLVGRREQPFKVFIVLVNVLLTVVGRIAGVENTKQLTPCERMIPPETNFHHVDHITACLVPLARAKPKECC